MTPGTRTRTPVHLTIVSHPFPCLQGVRDHPILGRQLFPLRGRVPYKGLPFLGRSSEEAGDKGEDIVAVIRRMSRLITSSPFAPESGSCY